MPDIYSINFFDPYYRPMHIALIFMLGACFGSFFNVCIYRIPLGISLSFPGSHCYRCGRAVRWYDNIPLLSYWVLRGHCRQCGAPFSMRYFLVELLTATLFTVTFLRIGYSLTMIPALIFLSLLIIGSFTDIDHWIVLDRISLGGLATGIVIAAIWPIGYAAHNPLGDFIFNVSPRLDPLANAAAGAAIGFTSLWLVGWIGSLIFRKDAMGLGDIKLFGMFGAFCGVMYLLHILLLACFIGSAVGGIGILRAYLARRRPLPPAIAPLKLEPAAAEAMIAAHGLSGPEKKMVAQAFAHPGPVGTIRHHLPFVPSLAIAAWVVYLYGDTLTRWFMARMMGDGGAIF